MLVELNDKVRVQVQEDTDAFDDFFQDFKSALSLHNGWFA